MDNVKRGWKIRVGLYACLLVIYSNAQAMPATDSLNWSPNLDAVIIQEEDLIAKTQKQQDKDILLNSLNNLYDAKLYILFQEYLKKLPFDQQIINIKLQQKWLLERKLLSDQASTRYQGSLGSSACQASIEATKKRIKAIQQLTGTQEGTKSNASSDKNLRNHKYKGSAFSDDTDDDVNL